MKKTKIVRPDPPSYIENQITEATVLEQSEPSVSPIISTAHIPTGGKSFSSKEVEKKGGNFIENLNSMLSNKIDISFNESIQLDPVIRTTSTNTQDKLVKLTNSVQGFQSIFNLCKVDICERTSLHSPHQSVNQIFSEANKPNFSVVSLSSTNTHESKDFQTNKPSFNKIQLLDELLINFNKHIFIVLSEVS